ncbi:MAG: hypothetical protein ACFFE8_14185 [Candidatus Heimdallarchaeota archaeon]
MIFKNRAKRWLFQAQETEIPLLLPQEDRAVIAEFLREKIEANEAFGIVTPDDTTFFPDKYIEQNMRLQLKEQGFIDICTLIDLTQGKLPGRILELKILAHVQDIDGFLDIIFRRFFTPQGAENFLKQYLGNKTVVPLRTILNDLYWGEDYVEAILDILSEKNLFRGYIDPIKQRLYNFTNLNFTSKVDREKGNKQLVRYIKRSFQLGAEVAISDICGLTGFSQEDSIRFLQKNRGSLSFVISTDRNYVYPTLEIIINILRDLIVYREVPIAFWVQRLDVAKIELLGLLRILNGSLNGQISPTAYSGPPLREWFQNGIDIEGLAAELNLDPLLLLARVRILGEKHGLRFIAGDTTNPFLLKGILSFEIFCQVDTSSYRDPHLYFECQNCKRILCSNCRSAGSKHSCPFCENIAAFIIDLPRHCPDCKITYTHSYNLISSEECYFCKRGPLGSGWLWPKPTSEKLLDPHLSQLLAKSDSVIPLPVIISTLGWSDAEVVAHLEEMIISNQINGNIDIWNTCLRIELAPTSFRCEVCEKFKTDKNRYKCVSCSNSVCRTCYGDMHTVGMVICPQCSGELKPEDSSPLSSSQD